MQDQWVIDEAAQAAIKAHDDAFDALIREQLTELPEVRDQVLAEIANVRRDRATHQRERYIEHNRAEALHGMNEDLRREAAAAQGRAAKAESSLSRLRDVLKSVLS